MFPVFNLDSYPGDTNRSCMTWRQVFMHVRKINQPSHLKKIKKQPGFLSAVSLTATLRHVSRESAWKKGLFSTGSQPSFSLTFPPGLVPHNEYEAHRAPEKRPLKNQVVGGSDKKNKNTHSIVKRSIIWSWSEWEWLNLVGGYVPMMLPKIGLQTWSHLSHSFGLQGFQLRNTVSKGCSVLFVTCAINIWIHPSWLLTLTHQAISRFLFTTPSNLLPFTNPCDLL